MSKPQTLTNIGTRLDLVVRQGSTLGPYRHKLTKADGTPFDLNGCTIRGQVRRTFSSEKDVVSFLISMADDPTQGYYEFELTADQTRDMAVGDALNSPESTYVWDSELELPGGRIIPLYYGQLRLHPEVTKT